VSDDGFSRREFLVRTGQLGCALSLLGPHWRDSWLDPASQASPGSGAGYSGLRWPPAV